MEEFITYNNKKVPKRRMFIKENSDLPYNGITTDLVHSFGCY